MPEQNMQTKMIVDEWHLENRVRLEQERQDAERLSKCGCGMFVGGIAYLFLAAIADGLLLELAERARFFFVVLPASILCAIGALYAIMYGERARSW